MLQSLQTAGSFICRACRSSGSRFFSTAPRRALPEDGNPTSFQGSLDAFRTADATRPPRGGLRGNINPRLAAAGRFLQREDPAKEAARKQAEQERAHAAFTKDLMERQMGRWWTEGDVYAPHDLTGQEMAKWKRQQSAVRKTRDVCDVLKINPLNFYKNAAMMSEYVSETGRIKGRSETGLRPINQRRMAKAIRRAVACGLMPSVHKHPEILRIKMLRAGRSSRSRSG